MPRDNRHEYPREVTVRRRSSGRNHLHLVSKHTYSFTGGPTSPSGTVEIPMAILSDPRIPSHAKVLYGLLKSHSGEPRDAKAITLSETANQLPSDYTAWIEHSILAASMGVKEETIAKWLQDMDDRLQLIERVKQREYGGLTGYRLRWETMDWEELQEWHRREIPEPKRNTKPR